MGTQDKRKILLVDDDTSLLVTLSDFLRFEGYEVVTADSGEQGMKRLERATPDLIILDMSMPGMGGVGFLKRISRPDGSLEYPVLVLTARANMAEFFSSVSVDGFVAKPCSPDDLLMEVGRIIFLRSGSEAPGRSHEALARMKVLIGEDDETVRENLVHAFTDAGFIVDSVSTGPAVMEKAIVQKPELIVMKYVLSEMNGDGVAEMLRKMPNTKDIPIVLYDETHSMDPDFDVSKTETTIRKVVYDNNSVSLLDAAKDVLAGTR